MTLSAQFASIAGNSDEIGLESFEKLAASVGIALDDIAFYIIAWKLKCETPVVITRSEFETGMKAMRLDSLDKLKNAIPNLRREITLPANFKDFYYFVFDWSRESKTAKYISNEYACELWTLLFQNRSCQFLQQWIQFVQGKYKKTISKDLWRQFLDFSTTSLEQYDPNAAWPTAIDEFVEQLKAAK